MSPQTIDFNTPSNHKRQFDNPRLSIADRVKVERLHITVHRSIGLRVAGWAWKVLYNLTLAAVEYANCDCSLHSLHPCIACQWVHGR